MIPARIRALANNPVALLAAIGLGGLILVGCGLVLSHKMNLAACPLCILQRMLYLLLAAEVLVLLPFIRNAAGQRIGGLLMAATAATGAFVAGYQTWIQRFAKDVNCTADQPWWEHFVNWAGTQSPWLFEASGLCSEAGWKFLGLSIAEWSLIMFLAMTLTALRAALLRRAALPVKLEKIYHQDTKDTK